MACPSPKVARAGCLHSTQEVGSNLPLPDGAGAHLQSDILEKDQGTISNISCKYKGCTTVFCLAVNDTALMRKANQLLFKLHYLEGFELILIY